MGIYYVDFRFELLLYLVMAYYGANTFHVLFHDCMVLLGYPPASITINGCQVKTFLLFGAYNRFEVPPKNYIGDGQTWVAVVLTLLLDLAVYGVGAATGACYVRFLRFCISG